MDFITLKKAEKLRERSFNKPTFGVDYMTYKQRRCRLPYTALDHKVISLNSPNSDIEGKPARRDGAPVGTPVQVITNIEPAISGNPYFAFDYFAEDDNIGGLRIDVKTDNSNYFRWLVDASDLNKGVNRIILNTSTNAIQMGTPNLESISSVLVRVSASAAGGHVFRVSEMETYKFKAAVTIWFDDGHSSVYYKAKPLMDVHGFKGVQSINGSKIGTDPSTQTATQLATMQAEGWEHCNHTFSHLKFGEVDTEQAVVSLQRGLDYCVSHNFGKASYYLVNPGGQTTPETFPYEKQYATLRRIGSGYNYLPIVDMFDIRCLEPAWETPASEVNGWIDTAIAGGLWLVLLFHQIRPDTLPGKGRYPEDAFEAIVNYLKTKQDAGDLQVVTCSEALSML